MFIAGHLDDATGKGAPPRRTYLVSRVACFSAIMTPLQRRAESGVPLPLEMRFDEAAASAGPSASALVWRCHCRVETKGLPVVYPASAIRSALTTSSWSASLSLGLKGRLTVRLEMSLATGKSLSAMS